MKKCYEMLNPGGILIVECPVLVHGNFLWQHSRIDLIEKLFDSQWSSVIFEHWREQHDDLMPYCPEHRKIGFKEQYNINLDNIWDLNIVAIK